MTYCYWILKCYWFFTETDFLNDTNFNYVCSWVSSKYLEPFNTLKITSFIDQPCWQGAGRPQSHGPHPMRNWIQWETWKGRGKLKLWSSGSLWCVVVHLLLLVLLLDCSLCCWLQEGGVLINRVQFIQSKIFDGTNTHFLGGPVSPHSRLSWSPNPLE